MPKKDLTGLRFGKLIVLEETDHRASNGSILWKCQCDCGNICEIIGSNLTRKKNPTQSCGCKTNFKDLTGQKFGLLTAIKPTGKRSNGKIIWKCLCDCGNIHFVNSGNLQSGEVRSCGCLNKKIQEHKKEKETFIGKTFNNWTILENTEKKRNNYFIYKAMCNCGNIEYKTISEIRSGKGAYCNKCHEHDLTGKVFTKLTVVKKVGRDDSKRSPLWLCKCECGNEIIVNSGNLISGNTKSCGCLNMSAGEYNIMKILQENNILFETQKTFEDCFFENTLQLARFDFYLPEYNVLLEYDGIQHFKPRNSGWGELLENLQARDNFKTKWCKENNIKLIRIPYTDFNLLSWNYLKEKLGI